MGTHESYIGTIRDLVVEQGLTHGTLTDLEADKLRHTRLLYGAGTNRAYGVCYFEAWENGVGRVDVVELGAMAQESWVQLTGTTVHELAHVIAGHQAGHGGSWKQAAKRLGFVKQPKAAGQVYHLSMFRPTLRLAAAAEAERLAADGSPAFKRSTWLTVTGAGPGRPCSAGQGSKGGTSYGAGRMRLWECECSPKPVKVRVASDDFQAICSRCLAPFQRR